jgi:hypothetical protein
VSWRRRWPWRHRLRDGGDVNKRCNHVVFPAAQEVFTLWKGVRSMEVLVQKAGQLWRNGPYRACLVGRCFPEAHVKLLELMPSDRKVDGGLLVGIDMNCVLVCVLLCRQRLGVFHPNDLQYEVRRRCTGKRRRRRGRYRWWWRIGRRRRGWWLAWRRILWLRSERRRHGGRRCVRRRARKGRHDRHPVRPRGWWRRGRRLGGRRGRRRARRGWNTRGRAGRRWSQWRL